MWIIGELVAIATDLAEFLGAALGFYLLFGMTLWIAGLITAIVTFLILLTTHRKAGTAAFWARSIAPNVVRRARVPMLLIRLEENMPWVTLAA